MYNRVLLRKFSTCLPASLALGGSLPDEWTIYILKCVLQLITVLYGQIYRSTLSREELNLLQGNDVWMDEAKHYVRQRLTDERRKKTSFFKWYKQAIACKKTEEEAIEYQHTQAKDIPLKGRVLDTEDDDIME
jgi:hypothetical protein